MFNKKDLKETYDRIAQDWVVDHQNDDWWIPGTDKFISYLKKGDVILDVGCAGGTKSKYLIDHELEVLGIDLSDKMIEIAKREVPQGRFQVMDLMDLNTLEQTFDGIFCQAVLVHVPKKDAPLAIEGMTDRLKDGGYLYFAVKEMLPGQIEEMIKPENDYGYEYQRFFSFYSLDELTQLLNKVGMNVIYSKVTFVGKTNWLEIIAKK